MKNIFFGLVIIALIVMVGVFLPTNNVKPGSNIANANAIVYKSPTCSCCVKYIEYLKQHNYNVKVVVTDDMQSIAEQYSIPNEMGSCHTMVIGDYFFEGHIPLEAVEMVTTDNPAIDGISLPAMPAGSPGMPGIKAEPFEIYQLINGQADKFISL